jgi:hypothetical protein
MTDPMETLVVKAKRLVERWYGCQPGDRRWLESQPPHSYSSSDYRVRLYVLEGSPPKGYVVASYSIGVVRALNHSFSKSSTFRLHAW